MLINSLLVEKLPPHLYGITYFGDNIQDEWFIVSLLFHLTREVEGLISRACDSDGEFLLIEAADHLPQWANPETCEQRVSLIFIFRFLMGFIRRLWQTNYKLSMERTSFLIDEEFHWTRAKKHHACNPHASLTALFDVAPPSVIVIGVRVRRHATLHWRFRKFKTFIVLGLHPRWAHFVGTKLTVEHEEGAAGIRCH